jgi:hypothetical protein
MLEETLVGGILPQSPSALFAQRDSQGLADQLELTCL